MSLFTHTPYYWGIREKFTPFAGFPPQYSLTGEDLGETPPYYSFDSLPPLNRQGDTQQRPSPRSALNQDFCNLLGLANMHSISDLVCLETPCHKLRELALKIATSLEAINPSTKQKYIEIHQKNLNAETIVKWEKTDREALKPLDPLYHENLKNRTLVGKYISQIRSFSEEQQFDKARNVFRRAVKEGHVDCKTFGTYLAYLKRSIDCYRDKLIDDPQFYVEKIKAEAVAAYVTSLREGVEEPFARAKFLKIMSL